MTQKKGRTPRHSPKNQSANNSNHSNRRQRSTLVGNSIKSQHARIIQALRESPGGLTTIQFVEEHDILRPGARICELRWEHDLNIKSVPVSDTTAKGKHHRVVRYVLHPGKWQGAA